MQVIEIYDLIKEKNFDGNFMISHWEYWAQCLFELTNQVFKNVMYTLFKLRKWI